MPSCSCFVLVYCLPTAAGSLVHEVHQNPNFCVPWFYLLPRSNRYVVPGKNPHVRPSRLHALSKPHVRLMWCLVVAIAPVQLRMNPCPYVQSERRCPNPIRFVDGATAAARFLPHVHVPPVLLPQASSRLVSHAVRYGTRVTRCSADDVCRLVPLDELADGR